MKFFFVFSPIIENLTFFLHAKILLENVIFVNFKSQYQNVTNIQKLCPIIRFENSLWSDLIRAFIMKEPVGSQDSLLISRKSINPKIVLCCQNRAFNHFVLVWGFGFNLSYQYSIVWYPGYHGYHFSEAMFLLVQHSPPQEGQY